MSGTSTSRALVVVGASAGGIQALTRLVRTLPEHFPCPVLVVVHIGSDAGGALPRILERAGSLTTSFATGGEALRPGHVLVAPPNHHLRVVDGHVTVDEGPREHGNRPSIDALFESAARTHGAETIGVILSGSLHDGAEGVTAIKRAGGRVCVQDPDDALYPAMPTAAIQAVDPDRIGTVEHLGRAIVELVLPEWALGVQDIEAARGPEDALDALGAPLRLHCPECWGVLSESEGGEEPGFDCPAGHHWSLHGLDEAHESRVERALDAAARMLEGRSVMLGELAARAKSQNRVLSAQHFEDLAEQAVRDGALIRRLLGDSGESEASDG